MRIKGNQELMEALKLKKEELTDRIRKIKRISGYITNVDLVRSLSILEYKLEITNARLAGKFKCNVNVVEYSIPKVKN